jgi:hypothetical protein
MTTVKPLSMAERIAAAIDDLELPENSSPAEGVVAAIKQAVRDEMLDETHLMLRNAGFSSAALNHPRQKK